MKQHNEKNSETELSPELYEQINYELDHLFVGFETDEPEDNR